MTACHLLERSSQKLQFFHFQSVCLTSSNGILFSKIAQYNLPMETFNQRRKMVGYFHNQKATACDGGYYSRLIFV